MRMPVPYASRKIKPDVPSRWESTACTSSRVNTTGKRWGRLALTTLSSHGNSIFKTSRYKNRIADSA